jgi:molybdopterin synthase sulfur carrier subunit
MADNADPKFTILYFAAASSFTNKTSELLPAPLPVQTLFSTLESRYPGITAKVLKSCAVTVNLEYVDLDLDSSANLAWDGASKNEGGAVIQAGDEVGIIPPVSSG